MPRFLVPWLLSLALTLTIGGAPALAQQTPAPAQGYQAVNSQQPYSGDFATIGAEIDRYWSDVLTNAGARYVSPGIMTLTGPTGSGCGVYDQRAAAFYCTNDQTIYLSPEFLARQDADWGDYAPIAVLAHEWGHHVQQLLGVRYSTTKEQEQQADCLTGAFTRHADDLGLLDYGDFHEVLNATDDAGDFLPEDAPGAHGTPEERVKAFSRGYGGGPVVGCALPLSVGSTGLQQPAAPPARPAPTAIPAPPPPAPKQKDCSVQAGFDENRRPVVVTCSGIAAQTANGPVAIVVDRRPPAPTPIPAPSPPVSVYDLLPPYLTLPQGQVFYVYEENVYTFDGLANRFADPVGAVAGLRQWGWLEGAYRIFASDNPPPNAAGWLEVHIHRFADAPGAEAALGYFAATSAAAAGLGAIPAPALGDRSVALAGPAYNGDEVTLYVRRGPFLIRVTGIAPNGDPMPDVAAAAQQTLARIDAR
ncbi:MAG: neutral zinc metallopeptidase [Thermomicrobiales bacterium]|nr:neutral zinc metallopeptidase [Thermomicrobiales bacterium]